ncbi:fimbrial protein [Escherichia coli]
MKKTLIALAVAASAAVSGSAMAWEQNGTGGSVGLSGTVDVLQPTTPWEVQVGGNVNDLNTQISSGATDVVISVQRVIPILGIRTVSKNPFHGQTGISPQINFGNAINTDSFSNGSTPLTLEVKDNSDAQIGTLTASFTAGAEASVSNGAVSSKFNIFAAKAGQAFYGGVAKSGDKITQKGWHIANRFGPEYVENYNDQNGTFVDSGSTQYFNESGFTYSAVYGAGILDNTQIVIKLNKPATSAITWKASLPIEVTYL